MERGGWSSGLGVPSLIFCSHRHHLAVQPMCGRLDRGHEPCTGCRGDVACVVGWRAGDLGLVPMLVGAFSAGGSLLAAPLLPVTPQPVLRANQSPVFCFCRGSVSTAPPSICPIGSLDRGQSQRDRRASSEAQIGVLSGSAKSEPRVPTPMRDWGVPDWELGMDCAWRETDQRCWSLMPPCLPASCNLQPITRRAQNAERTLNILGLHELASDSLDAALLPRRVAEFAMPVFCGSGRRGTSGPRFRQLQASSSSCRQTCRGVVRGRS